MKLRAKYLVLGVLAVCILMSLGLKGKYEPELSLTVVEHYGMRRISDSPNFPVTVVEIDGKTQEAAQFLSDLWQRNRPLFKDATIHNWGPDSGYTEIIFISGKGRLDVGSWHQIDGENPNLVVTSRGIESLNGRTREAVLSEDEPWYRDFRKGFDAILEAALKFKKEHAGMSSAEVKQARMSREQASEVAKKFAQEKGENLSGYQEPSAHYGDEDGKWWVGFGMHPPAPPGGHFSVTVDDKSGKPLELYPGE